MSECLFCKIINKEEPAEIIFENENYIVFPSKYPAAEKHFLILPKKHIQSIKHAEEENEQLIGGLMLLGAEIARQQGLEDYKLLFNAGKYAQIPHLHLHLIAGDLEDNT